MKSLADVNRANRRVAEQQSNNVRLFMEGKTRDQQKSQRVKTAEQKTRLIEELTARGIHSLFIDRVPSGGWEISWEEK